MIVCSEIKQRQPQDRKTVFETLSLPVAEILSPVARQAPTKLWNLQKTNSEEKTPSLEDLFLTLIHTHFSLVGLLVAEGQLADVDQTKIIDVLSSKSGNINTSYPYVSKTLYLNCETKTSICANFGQSLVCLSRFWPILADA